MRRLVTFRQQLASTCPTAYSSAHACGCAQPCLVLSVNGVLPHASVPEWRSTLLHAFPGSVPTLTLPPHTVSPPRPRGLNQCAHGGPNLSGFRTLAVLTIPGGVATPHADPATVHAPHTVSPPRPARAVRAAAAEPRHPAGGPAGQGRPAAARLLLQVRAGLLVRLRASGCPAHQSWCCTSTQASFSLAVCSCIGTLSFV